MSKKSEAKEKQGYVAKAVPQKCGNCAHYRFDMKRFSCFGGDWEEEVNRRCAIGGFAVKEMGTCNEWKSKEGGK